ncbi:transcriptional regulator CecR [Luteolibacter sp. GHJ8]|uniref:Transcriptional regulator CecR n=1 Tax=Luteolibacter rhizosphaerae TaxID=2989719 RepID=A0ABT3GAR4_9BACT|nr:transcriptional regulator CecR [Luteolibacter rhizosphaerae]MCW1916941.1 transcriptional regulator CecR [Luteolibacter rhizosphaerae]
MQRELFPTSPNKGEQARRRLLLAALKKFGEKGYENASVREIADEAEQNVAAIGYYFGSKERLYAAVLEGIGEHLRGVFSEVAAESRELLASGEPDVATAQSIIKRMLRTLLGEQLEGSEFEKIRLVMLREQAAPSENFELLYQKTLKPMHELFTRTVGITTGEDPTSTKLILRTHAMFGQVLAFTLARATILRRLGVKKLQAAHKVMIAELLDEHVDLICGGLAWKGSER